MPTSFISLSDQIDLNEKRLAFEYDRYESYNSRFTLVSIIYSVIAIYLMQLIQFSYSGRNHIKYLFIPILITMIGCLLYSLWHGINLVIPRDVSFLKEPKEFYEITRKQYEEKGITESEELNEYLRASYNFQLEEAVSKNAQLCFLKSEHFFKSFQFALYAIVPYLVCLSMYMATPKDDNQNVTITNYKEIESFQDSIILMRNNPKHYTTFDTVITNKTDTTLDMADAKKISIDTKKVIQVHPITVKEGENVKTQK